jgi:subtilisin family serine protease
MQKLSAPPALPFFLGLLFLLASGAPARAQEDSRLVPGRIVLTLRAPLEEAPGSGPSGAPATGLASLDRLNASFGARRMEALFGPGPGGRAPGERGSAGSRSAAIAERRDTPEGRKLERIYAIDLPPATDLDAALGAYAADPNVERAEPVREHFLDLVPNDPGFSGQPNLDQTGGPDISAVLAWSVTTGDSNVVIAILDTGVDWQHPDLGGAGPGYLQGNVFTNWAEVNGLPAYDDDGNGLADDFRGWDWVTGVSGSAWPGEDAEGPDNDPMDFNSHGTHVAGIASAITNNAEGIAGVGWSCRVLPCRVGYSMDDNGVERGVVRMDWAAQALVYAADMGAVSANASWGSSNTGGIAAAADYAIAQGVVICVAAGNSNNNVSSYLGSRGDCMDVAAVDRNDIKASFSSFGGWVDVSAPGVSIYSTYLIEPSTHTYAHLSGTSMAAPHVAGLCGLLKAAHPEWTGADIQAAIILSCDYIDDLNPSYGGRLGSGRINAAAALDVNPSFLRVPDDFDTIARALDFAEPEDTVAVQGGYQLPGPLVLDRETYILGGWDATFTACDPSGNPSLLRGGTSDAVVTFYGGSTPATVLEGFVIYNGLGKTSAVPELGKYGGGVFYFQAPGTLRRCVIRDNRAGSASTPGGGGGVFVWESEARLEECTIESNRSVVGGGLYVLDGSLVMTDCLVDSNEVVVYAGRENLGGGLYAATAGSLAVEGSRISDHAGWKHGGAVYLDGCTDPGNRFADVAIEGNTVSGDGGGLLLVGSALEIRGSSIAGNASGFLGGGASVTGGAFSASDVVLAENVASLGGALYSEGATDFDLLRCLVTGNEASFASSGLYVADAVSGQMAHLVVHGNTGPSAVAQVSLQSADLYFHDGVVSSGPGKGLQVAGVPEAAHAYNDVWDHAEGDFDVPGGPGEGEISADPLFADDKTGDFQLLVHSPCIDRGDTSAAARDPDGTRSDMGLFGGPGHPGTQPFAPAGLVAAFAGGGGGGGADPAISEVTLSWGASPSPGVAWYAVYRDTVPEFQPGAASFLDSVPAPDTTWTDPAPPSGATAYYRVSAVGDSGYGSGYTDPATPGDPPTPVRDALPRRLELAQNEPNPFNPATRIRFALDRAGPVRLAVYDAAGRLVSRLVDRRLEAGVHEVVWNGTNGSGRSVAGGVYFYRLETAGRVLVRKMVLVE